MSEKKGFTIIQNEIINSGKISLKAMGLFLYLKSKPKDWRFSTIRIQNDIKTGLHSIRECIKELEKANLIQRKKTNNKKGQFETNYIFLDDEIVAENPPTEVIEEPKIEIVKPKARKPVVKKSPPKKEDPKPEENLFPEPEKPKEEEPKTPPTTNEDGKLYAKMVEIYFDWFKGLSGVSPKFGQAEGASLKQIINYFKILYKANKKEGENEFDEVTKMFSFIFSHWNLIDPFYQKQTKLTQINSNIQNIINDIKNGHKRKSNSKDKSNVARGERLQKSFNRIDEMLLNKKQN